MQFLTRSEVLRQGVHLAQAWIVVCLGLFGLDVTMLAVAAAAVLAVVVEQYRRAAPATGLWQRWVVQHVVRPREASQWLGATYLFFGSLIILLTAIILERTHLFNANKVTVAAAAALIMLTIGDALSALIGSSLGGPTVKRHRHWSGALGFIIAGLLAYWLLPISLLVALALAVTATAAEFLTPRGWDDNLVIPVICFGLMLVV